MDENTPTTPETTPETPVTPTENNEIDFGELIKTDTKLQSFVKAESDKALNEYKAKQQILANEKLSEAEKLKTMTAEEIANYYKDKFEKAEADKERMRNAESLKSQTAGLLSDNKIPAEFIKDFDFENATADSIKNRITFLSGYEIYPKGTFEAKLNEKLNEKLRQKPPETHETILKNDDDAQLNRYFGII